MTVSFWVVFVCLMADVMMDRGHGGDDAEDPPPPTGRAGGHHEQDLEPRRNTRGKAKNLKLRALVKKTKKPVTLIFDREVTFETVGEYNDYFKREVGMYMWRSIPFDRSGWDNVSDAEKNCMHEHLKTYIDLDVIERDCQRNNIKDGIHYIYQCRYKARKHDAKKEFDDLGGKQNLEIVMVSPPDGMPLENWLKAVDHFCTDEFEKRSKANTQNRGKHLYTNRGGTSSYSSVCYKKNLSRLDQFCEAHTDKDGKFENEIIKGKCEALQKEYEAQTQTPTGEGTDPPDDIELFGKVMGVRRGFHRGLGHKLPKRSSASDVITGDDTSAPSPPSPLTNEHFERMFAHPDFQSKLLEFMANNSSLLKQKNVEDENDMDDYTTNDD